LIAFDSPILSYFAPKAWYHTGYSPILIQTAWCSWGQPAWSDQGPPPKIHLKQKRITDHIYYNTCIYIYI
jgi:hypothetical protein